jgi:glycosyltransferase involved in cell wall biosynthesis
VIAVPRIVLVGHDASATGVPRSALAFARWVQATGAADLEILLDRGGPLANGFEAAAPTHVRGRAAGEAVAAADALGGLTAGRWARRGVQLTSRPVRGTDVTVVAASAAAWRSAAAVAHGGRRLVLWLHELDGVADRIVAPAERAALVRATEHIVAVSPQVAAMAIERWGVAAEQVSVVESFVDPLVEARPRREAVTAAAEVVAVGSLVPRKGAEHLVALTALLRHDRPDLCSAWIGGPTDRPYADLIRTDRRRAGLDDAVRLVGPVDDVGPWWPSNGVVVHLAREDPAPLVVIEAALRAIPVVTWDTGGAAELLRAAGLDRLVAAPGDLVAVADAVGGLLDDGAARIRAGGALQDAAAGRTTPRLAPALLAAIVGGGT